jgi:NADPH-ferrihemoprotein reductase
MYLFYGCRKSSEDFLYKDEWPVYGQELKGKFVMKVAFSRDDKNPDGSESSPAFSAQSLNTDRSAGKVYVQDLLWNERIDLAPLILEKRAYIYICGDAKQMAKSVEEKLMRMLGAAKGGSAEVEGARELKLLKDRNVSIEVCLMVLN